MCPSSAPMTCFSSSWEQQPPATSGTVYGQVGGTGGIREMQGGFKVGVARASGHHLGLRTWLSHVGDGSQLLISLTHRDKDDILLGGDMEQEDRDLSDEERRFLKEFPTFKSELEATITKFHALADDMDKAHKTFTRVSMVSNTVSVVSDVMGILGLVLAPATAGGSLMLSAASMGFGTAAGAASTITDLLEYLHKKDIQSQANIQVPNTGQHLATNVAKSAIKLGTNIRDIEKNVNAFQIAKNYPRLAEAAEHLLTAGRVSSRTKKQVQRAFGGTTMVMSYTTRLQKSGMAFLALGMDLQALRKNMKDLEKGTTTELAEELRAKARAMESELTKLTKLYEHLKEKVRLCLPSGWGGLEAGRWNWGAWAPQELRAGC